MIKFFLFSQLNHLLKYFLMQFQHLQFYLEWFANDVNWNGNTYTFIWDDFFQEAELVKNK